MEHLAAGGLRPKSKAATVWPLEVKPELRVGWSEALAHSPSNTLFSLTPCNNLMRWVPLLLFPFCRLGNRHRDLAQSCAGNKWPEPGWDPGSVTPELILLNARTFCLSEPQFPRL